jgi:hypothetical protein
VAFKDDYLAPSPRRADLPFPIPACPDATFRIVGINLSKGHGPLRAQLIARDAEIGAGYVHSLKDIVVNFHIIGIVKTVTVRGWFGDGGAAGRGFCASGSCFSAASGTSLCVCLRTPLARRRTFPLPLRMSRL